MVDWGYEWRRKCCKNRGISIFDMTKVVHDEDLGGEVGYLLWRVVLGIRGNKPTLEVIHNNVFHVEAEIVTRQSLWERLYVSSDLTSTIVSEGPKVTTIPDFRALVSTRPIGTVPIPPIVYTS